MMTANRAEPAAGTHRRTWWVEVLLAAALAWLALIAYAEWRSEGRYLWLFGATYEAGQVPAGASFHHRVWVFNPTLRSLELDVQPTCGCTVVEGAQRVLRPLWGFPLTIAVDTTGKPLGRQVQQVDLIVRDRVGRVSWRERLAVRFEVVRASVSSTKR
jgi:hypothetical protein